MNVSVTIPTRGDVDLQPIIDSFPPSWEIVIWDNGSRMITRSDGWAEVCSDLAVYGRYAAIDFCTHDLILTQDDDALVSDPQAIVDAWKLVELVGNGGKGTRESPWEAREDHVVCNTPEIFRPNYPDSGIVGFGAAFHRDAPERAFNKFVAKHGYGWRDMPEFNRRADNVFTTLTPRVLVDVEKTDREMASDPSRMWKQPGHEGEKQRMIELARQVRDSV